MRHKVGLKTGCLILSVFMLTGILASCGFDDRPSFPSLETTTSQQTVPGQTTQPGSDIPGDTSVLVAALPLDNETLDAVRLIFLAKKSGLLNLEPGQYIGLQVMIDDLRQFDNGMAVDLISVPLSTGATADLVRIWQNSGSTPDIIYTRSVADSIGFDAALNLDPLLYDNPLFSAGHIIMPGLENMRHNGVIYGIPWLASVPVVGINRSLAVSLGLSIPTDGWTWSEWLTFFISAQSAIMDAGSSADPDSLAALGEDPEALDELLTRAVFVMDNPASLLTFLPGGFHQSPGWAMWDGQAFQYDDPIFIEAVRWLRDATTGSSTALHLDDAQRQTAFSGQDPVRSGRSLMWLTDSSAAADLMSGSKMDVVFRQLPAGDVSDEKINSAAPVYLSAGSLVVNNKSDHPKLAAELASFIALDADSLLVQSRYQSYSGFVPLVNDQMVWNAMTGTTGDWRFLNNLLISLPSAIFSNRQNTARWEQARVETLTAFGPALLLADDDATDATMIREMMVRSARILKGD